MVSVCISTTDEDCILVRLRSRGEDMWRGELLGTSAFFDYDSANNTLAIIIDESTIEIDGELYDLSNQVDGDIVGIEWMPSLFYYR